MAAINKVIPLKSNVQTDLSAFDMSASGSTDSVEVADFNKGSIAVSWTGTNAASKIYPEASLDGVNWNDIEDVDFDVTVGSGSELISFLFFPWKEVRLRFDALTNTSGTLDTAFFGVDKKG